jgi:hypothetical protein
MGKSPAVNRPLPSLGAWPARVVWLVLPLLAGPVLADALDDTSRSMQVVASAGLWLSWGVVLMATLVPRTVSLTGLRIVAPAGCVAVGVAVAASDEPVGWRVAALAAALVATGVAFAPSTGHAYVNGSSYGDEARFLLRVPAPLLLGPVEVVWLAVTAGAVSGPLLLAAKQWLVGGLAVVAGAALVWWGVRVSHTLARRWVVLVPAGMVLHDPLALADPILLRRGDVRWLGPAPADSDALDLTRGALGLALEARLKEPVPLGVVAHRRGEPVTAMEVDRLLFTPSRPGALLAVARSRHVG